MRRKFRLLLLIPIVMLLSWAGASPTRAAAARHFLYVAEPGIRNYVEFGWMDPRLTRYIDSLL